MKEKASRDTSFGLQASQNMSFLGFPRRRFSMKEKASRDTSDTSFGLHFLGGLAMWPIERFKQFKMM